MQLPINLSASSKRTSLTRVLPHCVSSTLPTIFLLDVGGNFRQRSDVQAGLYEDKCNNLYPLQVWTWSMKWSKNQISRKIHINPVHANDASDDPRDWFFGKPFGRAYQEKFTLEIELCGQNRWYTLVVATSENSRLRHQRLHILAYHCTRPSSCVPLGGVAGVCVPT